MNEQAPGASEETGITPTPNRIPGSSAPKVQATTPESSRDLRASKSWNKVVVSLALVGSHVLCGLIGFAIAYSLSLRSKPDDLRSARTVCEGFLMGLDNNSLESAHRFTTKKLQQSLTPQNWSRGQGKLTWTINSESISEDRNEATFHGTWTFEHGVRQNFVVTVVKHHDRESGGGQWLVDGYSFSNPL
jgi:hypothetical protein